MTHEEQLNLWVDGKSIHNDETEECCHDFSCCKPELLVDRDTRVMFQADVLSEGWYRRNGKR